MFGGLGNKQTSSNTTNNTTNNYTDTSANAGGDGSLAVSGGGSINIETSDPQVVAAAMATVQAQSGESTKQMLAAMEAVRSDRELSSRSEAATQNAAQRAIETTTGLAAQLAKTEAAKVSDPSVQILTNLGKYAAIGAAVLGVGVVAILIFRKK